MKHRSALITISVAAAVDVACGFLYAAAEHIGTGYALYCAVGNAVTEGACTTPATPAGHWVNLTEFLLVVPLFAATFSLFTSGLASARISQLGSSLHTRLQRIEENHRRVCTHLGLPPAPPGPGLPEVPGG